MPVAPDPSASPDRPDSTGRPDPAAKGDGGVLAPLRERTFRTLWSANLLSNLGWLIQGVGAAWLMTSLTDSSQMVALVQTMTQLPALVFALLAGAAADIWDRRTVLIWAQFWMLAVSVLLALLAMAGMVTPVVLLAFTFALGAGAAVNGPTFQSVVRELVRPEMLAAAVTINAVAFNLARAIGPGLGGGIVAVADAQGAFLFNALTYVPLTILLILTRPPKKKKSDLPREKVGSAMVAGMRYVWQSPDIWHALGRAILYGFAAPAILALLPLLARDELGVGPIGFGLLLGVFGIGALIGAFVLHDMRQRFGAEIMVTVMTGVYGGAYLILGLTSSPVAVVAALFLAGACWLGAFSTFSIIVQMSAAPWVQARVLAIHQMGLMGAMALGSWFWGFVADFSSLSFSLTGAGVAMLVGLLLAPLFRLTTAKAPDLSPARSEAPVAAVSVADGEGPILNQIEYRVPLAKAPRFAYLMDDLGHVRRRNGAVRWRLFQDVADPEHWIETYLLADWIEQRRFHERITAADMSLEERVLTMHAAKEPPIRRHMIARRADARLALDPAEADRARPGREK